MKPRKKRRKGSRRNLGAVAGLVALAGCTSHIDELKNAQIRGSAFDQALAKDYQAYVDHQVAQDNWHYANYFAGKGLEAAKGANVGPEDLAKWNIPADKRETLDSYRRRLLAVLNGPAREARPAYAARAQVEFDCWVQKLEENNITVTHAMIAGSDTITAQPDEYAVAACKNNFLTQLAKAEAK